MKEEPIEVIEYKGYNIEIYPDFDSISPRENDNLGIIGYNHSRYILGDKEIKDFSFLTEKEYIFLPLYIYDHSGITMKTSPFNCPWDSGQVGYIFVNKDKIKKEYSAKKISKKLKDKVIDCLESEVKEYDKYLRGDIYGYMIKNKNGEEIDSCWGFYEEDYMIKEAKDFIDWEIENTLYGEALKEETQKTILR